MEATEKPNILIRRFAHPWMPSLLYFPLSFLLIYLSSRYQQRTFINTLFFVILGIFSWSLVEYVLHRFIFHWTQVREPWKSLASGLHMAHHRSTDEEDLILAPPFVSMLFGGLIYLLFALFSLSWNTAALLEAGLLIGYVFYEWVHFGAHRFKMSSPLGKYLKQYHLRHHFKNPRTAYGVTSPLWDFIFKTIR